MPARVLLTDYAWPDLTIEREILGAAGVELIVAPQTDPASLVAAARDVDAIMTTWAKVTAEVIAAAPRCRLVSRLGIGLDNIDVAYCSQHGIPVTNVPDYCVHEVAEHALALLLGVARNIAYFHCESRAGRYDLRSAPPMRRITGQTLGIVGLGQIGKALATRAMGIGLRVIATNRSGRCDLPGVTLVTLDELFSLSDFVSLHVPLTPETRHLVAANRLAQMKPTALLINTSRGGLLDQAALAEALARGQLAGAALDVQDPEPPDLSQPPFNDPRVLVTPHAAFVSQQSLWELRERAARQVAIRLSGGEPPHIVNRAALTLSNSEPGATA